MTTKTAASSPPRARLRLSRYQLTFIYSGLIIIAYYLSVMPAAAYDAGSAACIRDLTDRPCLVSTPRALGMS